MTRIASLAVLLLLCGGATSTLSAQTSGIGIEVAGGVSIPTGGLSSGDGVGEGVASGPSLGVALVNHRSDRVSVALGFTQHRFGCSDAGCGDPDEYVVTGLNLGARISLLPGRRIEPRVGFGLITATVESRGLPSPDDGVSSTAVGGEVRAGLSIGLTPSVSLQPIAAWALANPSLPGGDELALRYMTAHLALEVRF